MFCHIKKLLQILIFVNLQKTRSIIQSYYALMVDEDYKICYRTGALPGQS